MDWQSVLTSVVSSAAFVAVATFSLRRFIDQSLRFHFAKRERRFETFLSLRSKRWERITDAQMACYKTTLGQVYAIRNACRDIRDNLPQDTEGGEEPLRSHFDQFFRTLEDNRAIYHPAVWSLVHSYRQLVISFLQCTRRYSSLHRNEHSEFLRAHEEEAVVEAYSELDRLYAVMTAIIQESIGVDDPFLDLANRTVEP